MENLKKLLYSYHPQVTIQASDLPIVAHRHLACEQLGFIDQHSDVKALRIRYLRKHASFAWNDHPITKQLDQELQQFFVIGTKPDI